MNASAVDSPRGRVPGWIVPAGLLLVSVLSIGAVFWGSLVADPQVRVYEFDAGPVEGLEIGRVRPFSDIGVYVVGLADGRVRAVDGRVRSSECMVEWKPEDARGVASNPRGYPGVFEDPCSGAIWAVNGNQIQDAGTVEALRAFEVAYTTIADGRQHVFVEVLGRDLPATPVPVR